MPFTKGEPLAPIELPKLPGDVKEMLVGQLLTGLRIMPQMLPKVEASADKGDEVSKEVVRRFKESK